MVVVAMAMVVVTATAGAVMVVVVASAVARATVMAAVLMAWVSTKAMARVVGSADTASRNKHCSYNSSCMCSGTWGVIFESVQVVAMVVRKGAGVTQVRAAKAMEGRTVKRESLVGAATAVNVAEEGAKVTEAPEEDCCTCELNQRIFHRQVYGIFVLGLE